MPQKPISVLIADDSNEDRLFLNHAIGHFAASFRVVGEVVNGLELVDYLSGKNEYADRSKHPFPDLLLMDLRMPEMDGFQVLEWLQKRSFPGLKVAVLADSSGIAYRSDAIEMGAHYFLSKLAGTEGMAHALTQLQQEIGSSN
jgi:CheY-like chemotaxis protein